MTFRIYTRVNGKLAMYEVEQAANHAEAIVAVQQSLTPLHKTPILAVIK